MATHWFSDTRRHGAVVSPRRSMSVRWNRWFAVLLGLSLVTAVVSMAVVQRVQGTFADATDEVSNETAAYDQLVDALRVEEGAAHRLVDFGAVNLDAFLGGDAATSAAFDRADAVYDEAAELQILRGARAAWQHAFAEVRALADGAARTPGFNGLTGDADDAMHIELGITVTQITASLQDLDQLSRATLAQQVAAARRQKTTLLVVLGALFALSAAATTLFGRQLVGRVIRPIHQLWEAADRFRDGNLDHRIELPSNDEIGELAQRFNSMAETIASTHRRLAAEATRDVLTGLANRASFLGDGSDATSLPDAPTVLFIDLDDFKRVNDDLGHAAGDDLLRQVAERLEQATRVGDVVARLGGDEFAVRLADSVTPDRATEVADRMLSLLAQPFTVHGATVRIGASIGIAEPPDEPIDVEQLLRNADAAMYAAKDGGKHQWQVFDPRRHRTPELG